MKKTFTAYFILTLLFSFYSFSPSVESFPKLPVLEKENKYNEIPYNGYQIKTIVLDAGHGGKDAGCSGHKSKEKHIALNLVLKLGKAIEQQFPYINVIYTRKTDVFIPLYKRAAIANKNSADLFISIHCNALSRKAPHVHGSETYVMGLHTAEHNLDVARRENESILLEDDYQKNYQGFDPNSDEGHIFLTMFQNAFLDKSIQFAEKVESKIKVRAKRKSRGVKQAGFVVLKETTMPSVLIESGYLTNSNEEAFLSTNSGQNKMANAIFEAFVEYKLEVEETTIEPIATIENAPIPVQVTSNNYLSPPVTQNQTSNIQQQANTQQQSVITPKVSSTATPKAISTKLAVVEKPSIIIEKKKPIVKAKKVVPVIKESAIVFKIQLAASPSEIDTSNKKWSSIPYVEVRKEKRLYKYLTGSHTGYEAAIQDRNEVLKKGFNGAFIVAYKDGIRMSLKEAKSELGTP